MTEKSQENTQMCIVHLTYKDTVSSFLEMLAFVYLIMRRSDVLLRRPWNENCSFRCGTYNQPRPEQIMLCGAESSEVPWALSWALCCALVCPLLSLAGLCIRILSCLRCGSQSILC